MVQLTRYAAALEHPPLLVVCDTIRFQILTTWTNLETKKYSFELEDLADPEKFNILRSVFHNPDALKPTRTRAMITAEAARKFQSISDALQHRNPDREAVAHFVNQLVFCFFADSVKLLPEGLLKKLLLTAEKRPGKSKDYFAKLFAEMEHGGEFDLTEIAWFNGGLFDGRAPLDLEPTELGLLYSATESRLEPDRPDHFRHAVRALSRSRQARADRRPLHRSRKNHDDRRSRRAAPVARAMGGGVRQNRADHAPGHGGRARGQGRPKRA